MLIWTLQQDGALGAYFAERRKSFDGMVGSGRRLSLGPTTLANLEVIIRLKKTPQSGLFFGR